MSRAEATGTEPLRRPHPATQPQPVTPAAVVGVAWEVAWNCRYSPIGGVQRHYSLDPLLLTAEAVCGHGVVVVIGAKAAYAFPADVDGHIGDHIPVLEAPGVTADADLLALLGYTVAADTAWGS